MDMPGLAGWERSAWMTHLLAFYAKNKGSMSFKDAMKEAKKTYKGT